MFRSTGSSENHVLLVVDDGPAGRSLVQALETATVDVEWAKSVSELRARAARSDLPRPELVYVDLELSDSGGEDVVPLVRVTFPLAAVVALAGELSGEGAARLLCQGVPSLKKPVSPIALAGLALRLSGWSWRPAEASDSSASTSSPEGEKERGALLASVFTSYARGRVLSRQQQLILRLYLSGQNDKEIARICRCAEATVYEHWRRMARKVGGAHKGDVIADFHRFLGGA